MALHAGELRELITIKRPERIQNNTGGFVTEYQTLIERTYSSVKEVTASADVIASQENIKTLVQMKMRYRPTIIKIGDLIEWRGFNFIVASSMKVDPLRTTITITAVSEMETTKRSSETEA